jgi:hypothetical protein
MAYLGNTPSQQAFTPAVDYFNGTGSATAFTLSRPVASVAQVQVTIENVPQNPSSAFTVSGSTITFTSAPPSGTSNIYVQYTSPITTVIAPGQGTVNTTQLGSSLLVPVASGGTGAASLAAASIATYTGTETLTNKTLTAPIVSYSINAQTTAAYVTVASDAGAIVTVSNASANTFKLPTNASVAYAIGSTITLIQIGAGLTTISAVTAGTTIVLSTGATAASPTLGQYKSATCIKTGTDAWYVIGALS